MNITPDMWIFEEETTSKRWATDDPDNPMIVKKKVTKVWCDNLKCDDIVVPEGDDPLEIAREHEQWHADGMQTD